jgi:hypothetical protein
MSGTATDRASAPPLRRVAAQILTPLGWLSGILHVPAKLPLIDFLATSSTVIALTQVRVPKEPEPVPFMALDQSAFTLVAPSLAQELVERPGRFGPTSARDVACFLADGILRGRFEVPLNLRVSDHLRQAGDFLVIRHGMLTNYGETLRSPSARALDVVIVRRSRAVGMAEWS